MDERWAVEAADGRSGAAERPKGDRNVTEVRGAPLVPATGLVYPPGAMKTWLVRMTLVAAIALLFGCGDGRPSGTAGNDSTLVGGACMNGTECDQGLCEMGQTFPGGMCTISCGDTNQCPSGSSCGELESGWVCLVDCMTDDDCRTQWSCQTIIEAGTNMESTKTLCLGSAPAP